MRFRAGTGVACITTFRDTQFYSPGMKFSESGMGRGCMVRKIVAQVVRAWFLVDGSRGSGGVGRWSN